MLIRLATGLQMFGWSLFVIACTLPTEQIQEDYLILSCDLPQDSSGIYQYQFPISLSQSYLTIHVPSTPLARVYFSSPNTFCVYLHGMKLCYPIVNYSIYTRESSGTGKQFASVQRTHIGETLLLEGITDGGSAASILINVEDSAQMFP